MPYYRSIIRELGDSYREDPFEYLKHMPVLTKAVIRENFEDLKSDDLPKRRWYVNTTGGSTGEPVEFVQDREFNTLNGPVTSLISWLIGADIGEPIAFFWGSIHDIRGAEEGWKAKSLSWLSNNRLFSVYHLDSRTIDHYLDEINRRPPKLIIGYANSMNEIAKYIEKTGRRVTFEYALVKGINDSRRDAEELAARLKGMNCHVNLIPLNHVVETGFRGADSSDALCFKDILDRKGIQTTIRRELGSDIDAACGQLRLKNNKR